MAKTLEVLKETALAYDISLNVVKRFNYEYSGDDFYDALDQELINRRTRTK